MTKAPTHIDQKLLVLYLLGEISGPGRARVEGWLASSEENRLHFESFRKTWDETGKIDPAGVSFDTNRAWERIRARVIEDVEVVKDVKGGKNRNAVWRAGRMRFYLAAAAVMVFVVASVVFVRFLQNRQEAGPIIMASRSVPVQDTLSDGSTVVLNRDSKLTLPKKFAGNMRSVQLSGEAFFQVERDSARPFIIDAGIGRIRVLGTSFQVKAYPGSDLEVYVESGRVELSVSGSSGNDTLRLVIKSGERGMIPAGSRSVTKPAEIGPDELFWANKKLIFQETKLSLVFDLLKKHYGAEIEVRSPAILNCLLSATFTDEPIDRILEVVTASFDLKMSREKQKFIIQGKGCGNDEN